jgi:hypothetical protein
VTPPIDSLPDDLESLKRLLAAERAARIDAEAKATSAAAAAARAAANVSSAEALIAHLKLAIEKMRRELYGSRSEPGRKLLDQMELELEDVEAAAAEDEIAAKMGAARAAARPRWFRRTRAASRCASHSPRICRASESSCRARPPAHAAARRGFPSSAKTSPRRSRSFRVSGK